MREPECPFFEETADVSRKNPIRLKVKVKVGDRELPVFGEKREFPRDANDCARFHIVGICNAIGDQVAAVEDNWYESRCMQSNYQGCARFRNRDDQTSVPTRRPLPVVR